MTQAANLAALGTNAGTTGILPAAGGGTGTASGVTGFKNRIINGAMVIDQRNAGASVSLTASVSSFTLDRFRSDNSTDGAFTVQRVTDAPTGFVNSMKYTVTTADTSLSTNQYLGLNHFIEGFNTADLMWGTANAKTITVSFWVKSSITGNYPIAFDNNAGDRFYIGQYTISVAGTWEYKTVTIAGDISGTWLTNNDRGVSVRWWLGSGTGSEGTINSWQTGAKYTFSGAASVIGTINATWQITGVQLEVGSTATSFDYRPYGTELALCQRYCHAFSSYSFGRTRDADSFFNGNVTLGTTMRAAPTLRSGATYTVNTGSAGTPSIRNAAGSASSPDSVYMENTSANWTTSAVVALTGIFEAEL
jgi:hypothetical protein